MKHFERELVRGFLHEPEHPNGDGLVITHGAGSNSDTTLLKAVAVAFAREGKTIVTASHDRSARLWEAATGKPLTAPLLHKDAVVALAISPDQKTLGTASHDQTARLWDLATGKPHWVMLGRRAPSRLHRRTGCEAFQAISVVRAATGIRVLLQIVRNSNVPHFRMHQPVKYATVNNCTAADARSHREI